MYRSTIDLNCDLGEGYGHWSYGDAPDSARTTQIRASVG